MKIRAAFGATRWGVAALLACGLSCGALGARVLMTPAAAQGSISDKLNSWFFGAPVKSDPQAPVEEIEIDCPGVGIRPGASTLAITAPGAESGPMSMRYQATIGETARECSKPAGGNLTMRVGVQGRVLLGPAGGAGQLDVPLRVAVVREGAEPKTIWTKFYKLNVTIPPGSPNVPFVYIEPNVTFPMPSASDLENYVVYVGFDPLSLQTKPELRRKTKKKK